MIQKSSFKVLMLFAVLVCTSSCEDYPDGPKFSIYSKTERVIGNWRFALVKIDGEDLTKDFEGQTVNISRGGNLYWIQGYYPDGYNFWGPGGEWKFIDDKMGIEMHFFAEVEEEYTIVWEITRLRYGDLRLQRYDGNKLIEWRMWKY